MVARQDLAPDNGVKICLELLHAAVLELFSGTFSTFRIWLMNQRELPPFWTRSQLHATVFNARYLVIGVFLCPSSSKLISLCPFLMHLLCFQHLLYFVPLLFRVAPAAPLLILEFPAPVDLPPVRLVVSLVPPAVFYSPPRLPAVLAALVPAAAFLEPWSLAPVRHDER